MCARRSQTTKQPHYIVEDILKIRKHRGKEQYKVKWQGYPLSECTWEPEESFGSRKTLELFLDAKKEREENQQNKSQQNKKKVQLRKQTKQDKKQTIQQQQAEQQDEQDENEALKDNIRQNKTKQIKKIDITKKSKQQYKRFIIGSQEKVVKQSKHIEQISIKSHSEKEKKVHSIAQRQSKSQAKLQPKIKSKSPPKQKIVVKRAIKKNGQLFFSVIMEGNKKIEISRVQMHEKYPLQLLDFYEQNLSFE